MITTVDYIIVVDGVTSGTILTGNSLLGGVGEDTITLIN